MKKVLQNFHGVFFKMNNVSIFVLGTLGPYRLG